MEPPPSEAPPPREMNVNDVSQSVPGDRQEEKAAALQKVQGIDDGLPVDNLWIKFKNVNKYGPWITLDFQRITVDYPEVMRLVRVRCRWDPAWSLELLQRAAPTVERLEVFDPRESHLRAVHAMPRLRRLRVSADGALDAAAPELGALPPGHDGLRWLRASRLPRATLQSLLQAHAGTLEELELEVGTPREAEEERSCSDLHSLLGRCGLRALRRLVLCRFAVVFSHSDTACWEQCAAVRAALPGLQVLCDECDRVQKEHP
ncbi:Paramyosin [Frankliniella fusca]|uniref:Paramyosin n=1 Tax=Frankliniella fusca TaxID=407009 RepID=A0AAE1HEX7_9NEOP|nr:Paramyosin [Frankliniella fusca]